MIRNTCYAPLPISFTHGKGVWLYDEHNDAYLDGIAGIAVCGLGHAHPEVAQTIQEQAHKLMHVSNMFHIMEQEQLADTLARLTGADQIFFSNSGAEANEAAIKLARLYGHQKNIENPTIIVMEGAFHGRTMATLTASGNRKVQAGFEPLLPGFIRAPFNDLEAIKRIAAHRNDIVAVLLEPIQGEGGVHVAEDAYFTELAALAKAHDWLFMVDEVQTGNGRTGALFAYQHTEVQPDVFTTAKGLGNGMPIGACLMRGKASHIFKVGNHGSTFGGNPLATKTASTVLKIIERDKLCEHAAFMGAYLKEGLIRALGDKLFVRSIRGRGLMLGIELDRPAGEARIFGLKNKVLFSVTKEQVIRLLPPLIISREEADELLARVVASIVDFSQNS